MNTEYTWRGYTIYWCDMCGTFSIKCKDDECHGSVCNGGQCNKCRKDIDDFSKLGICTEKYMTKDEIDVVEKYLRIKDLLPICLSKGKAFDLKWLDSQGRLCQNDRNIFKLIT